MKYLQWDKNVLTREPPLQIFISAVRRDKLCNLWILHGGREGGPKLPSFGFYSDAKHALQNPTFHPRIQPSRIDVFPVLAKFSIGERRDPIDLKTIQQTVKHLQFHMKLHPLNLSGLCSVFKFIQQTIVSIFYSKYFISQMCSESFQATSFLACHTGTLRGQQC